MTALLFPVPANSADATSFNPVNTSVKAKSGSVPVGTIIVWSSNTDPKDADKWLECDGRAVDSAKYPRLYALMHNTPNLQGRFLRGKDSDHGVLQNVEDTIKSHTSTVAEHTHELTGTGTSTGGISGIAAGQDYSSKAALPVTGSVKDNTLKKSGSVYVPSLNSANDKIKVDTVEEYEVTVYVDCNCGNQSTGVSYEQCRGSDWSTSLYAYLYLVATPNDGSGRRDIYYNCYTGTGSQCYNAMFGTNAFNGDPYHDQDVWSDLGYNLKTRLPYCAYPKTEYVCEQCPKTEKRYRTTTRTINAVAIPKYINSTANSTVTGTASGTVSGTASDSNVTGSYSGSVLPSSMNTSSEKLTASYTGADETAPKHTYVRYLIRAK